MEDSNTALLAAKLHHTSHMIDPHWPNVHLLAIMFPAKESYSDNFLDKNEESICNSSPMDITRLNYQLLISWCLLWYQLCTDKTNNSIQCCGIFFFFCLLKLSKKKQKKHNMGLSLLLMGHDYPPDKWEVCSVKNHNLLDEKSCPTKNH